MSWINRLNDSWIDLMENKSDQRTTNWPMMASPFPTLCIIFTYVYFVKVLGPKLMENRKPFQFRKLLIAYNFMHVLISFYLFWEGGMAGWFGQYNFFCEPYDKSTSKHTMRMVSAAYCYYLSKFPELFDTIFFVLRKRYDQVSTLHVIHHGAMPFAVWLGVKYVPTGHLTFFGFLNAFVHIIMYAYYMLAAIGPEMQKYLWWKKYLTTIQMIQFIAIIVHALQLLVHNPCNYPTLFSYLVLPMAFMFLVLFASFYKKAYTNSSKRPQKRKSSILEKEFENYPESFRKTS